MFWPAQQDVKNSWSLWSLYTKTVFFSDCILHGLEASMPSYGCPASLNSKKPFLEQEKHLSTSSQSYNKKRVPFQSYCLHRLINDFSLASTIAMLQQGHKRPSAWWYTSPTYCLASSLVWISLDRYSISHGERSISDLISHSLVRHPQ